MLARKLIVKQLFVVSVFSLCLQIYNGVLFRSVGRDNYCKQPGGRIRKKAHNCHRIHLQAGFEGMLTNYLLSMHLNGLCGEITDKSLSVFVDSTY